MVCSQNIGRSYGPGALPATRSGYIRLDSNPAELRLVAKPMALLQVQTFNSGFNESCFKQEFMRLDQLKLEVDKTLFFANITQGVVSNTTDAGGRYRREVNIIESDYVEGSPQLTHIKAQVKTYHNRDAMRIHADEPLAWRNGDIETTKLVHITITHGNLQHQEANLGINEWFAIDDGTTDGSYYHYDDRVAYSKPIAGRWDQPIVPMLNRLEWFIDPDNEFAVRHWTMMDRMIAQGRAVEYVPDPTERVIPRAEAQRPITPPSTANATMPTHIKQQLVEMAKALNKTWECCVCCDDKEPSLSMMTECGHYLCSDCCNNWKLEAHQHHKSKWQCPECRCEFPLT